MTRRRGRNGHSEDLLPKDRVAWAKEVWADREEVAKLPGGVWLLREAARALDLPEKAVDDVLKGNRSS